jgi:glycosyltransferase involved in cell wall biosynthesis
MRILQLIDTLDVGGGERMAVNLTNYFSESKIPNLLISTRMGGPLESFVKNPRDLLIFSKYSALDFVTFGKVVRKVKLFGPTVIHAHDSSIFWAVLLKFFFSNIIVVWHAHYGGFSSHNARFGKKVKFLQPFIDRVIVVNKDLLAWVKSSLPNIPKVSYIGNFPEKISESSVDRQDLKWIISVANLKKPKNHVVLILAFSEFLKSHPGFNLALIGSKDDPNYLKEVLQVLRTKGLDEKVYLAGPVMDLEKWFSRARFAVLSSDTEGLPVSLLELGLSGVPIISSKVGACADLLENGRCGFLVEPNNSKELCFTMRYLVDHQEESIAKAKLFENKVKTEFGGDNFLKEYRALLGIN